MVFSPNIPQPNDLLSVSQGDILANFQQANTIMAADHYEFNFTTAVAPYDIAGAADRGKHRQVKFIRASADIGTGANEIAVYVKNDGGGNAQLFMRRQSNGNIVQMTAVDPSAAVIGHSYLPGGILIHWGQASFPNTVNTQAVGFVPNFSGVPYTVLATRQSADPNNRTVVVSPGTMAAASVTFLRYHSDDNHTFNWLAIGPA